MPQKISSALGVTAAALEAEGVLNTFIDIDSRFHLDPHLLESTKVPELSQSYEKFKKYFEDLIHIIASSRQKGDVFWRRAQKKLTLREKRFVGLGYSKSGTSGSAIGKNLANEILETASELVAVGIKDPIIFELIGLLQEGMGADRISDMTLAIIYPDLLKFSERVARNLGIETRTYQKGEKSIVVPYASKEKKPVILIPKDIVRPLPIAECWEDIDFICSHNESLRNRVNEIIGDTWKQATTRVRKSELRSTLLRHPALIEDLINQYREKPAETYDFNKDPAGEIIWYETAKSYVNQYPLDLSLYRHLTPELLFELVKTICLHFKKLVEDNGLFALFYNDDNKKLKNERAAQLLFFGVADSYCSANDIDVSREANAGRGAVDFKFSRGYNRRVNVEVKYSINTHLMRGYKNQLPIYNRAERVFDSIYLVGLNRFAVVSKAFVTGRTEYLRP
jgi:hypothetical protein